MFSHGKDNGQNLYMWGTAQRWQNQDFFVSPSNLPTTVSHLCISSNEGLNSQRYVICLCFCVCCVPSVVPPPCRCLRHWGFIRGWGELSPVGEDFSTPCLLCTGTYVLYVHIIDVPENGSTGPRPVCVPAFPPINVKDDGDCAIWSNVSRVKKRQYA